MILNLLIETRSEFINIFHSINVNEDHEFLISFNDQHNTTIMINDFGSVFMFVIYIGIAP